MAHSPYTQGEQLKKNNKYKLDKKADAAAKMIVMEAVVQYDIDTDKFKSILALRRDVDNDELVLRIARQMEGAMRTVMPPYESEMALVESLASAGAGITKPEGEHDSAPVS